jgi:hypothetical protein
VAARMAHAVELFGVPVEVPCGAVEVEGVFVVGVGGNGLGVARNLVG